VRRSERLADLYFRLEQINRTIAALEHFAILRERRQARLRRMPPSLMRDALGGRMRESGCARRVPV
jgi:hypothetical protein